MSSVKPADQNNCHVLIIGAGITGLLIAQGLKKAGIPFQIFEAESVPFNRPREWTMAIHWSISILKKLLPSDTFAKFSTAECDPSHDRGDNETIHLLNNETGEVIKSLSTPGMKRVSQRKLRVLCSDGIGVMWGKKLSDVSYGQDSVTVRFDDGSSYTGSVLVGADGSKSKVRELLLGPEKAKNTPMPIDFHSTIVNYADAAKAQLVRSGHPLACPGYGPSNTFSFIAIQDIPDPTKPETWAFQVGCSWLGQRDPQKSNESRLKAMKEVAEKLGNPYRSAIMWIPDETPIYNDSLSYWVPIPWETGKTRVTLAGDAVHPLPPHRGQGANHSMLDATNFVDIIVKINNKEVTIEDGLASYNEEIIKRGAEEVKVSVAAALDAHNWEKFKESPLMKHGVKRLNLESK